MSINPLHRVHRKYAHLKRSILDPASYRLVRQVGCFCTLEDLDRWAFDNNKRLVIREAKP